MRCGAHRRCNIRRIARGGLSGARRHRRRERLWGRRAAALGRGPSELRARVRRRRVERRADARPALPLACGTRRRRARHPAVRAAEGAGARAALRIAADRQVARPACARAAEGEDRRCRRRSPLRRWLDLWAHRAPRTTGADRARGAARESRLLSRGGASAFGYAETNEDLFAYGMASHPHVPEIETALTQAGGAKASVAFTPHLVSMSRGLLATCYARPRDGVRSEQLHDAAAALYANEPFIRLTRMQAGAGPHTGWATGSNFAFLSYAINARTGLVVALGAIDNLGKGAAGQALQNANLMTGQPETAGLGGLPV